MSVKITALAFDDAPLGELNLQGRRVLLRRGLGSGLTRRAGEAPDTAWAIGDRGPNLATAERRVKIMPTPQFGPAIAQLRVSGDEVRLVRTLALTGRSGRAISGLPLPGETGEVAVDVDGQPHAGDPSGADTEGIAALRAGGFWIADEYGPSLLRVAEDGRVAVRWIPAGTAQRFAGADYDVAESLPAIAATRRLNRGFEGLALSPDERWLYVAFQSPLTGEAGQRVRLWQLDAITGQLVAEWVYPLDEPQSFLRDCALGPFGWDDIKLCELQCLDARRLLVLERGSATSRLYVVERPGAGDDVLVKSLLLDSDQHPEIGVDLEGVTLLSSRSLLLVNDNDFGVEGVQTRFWRVDLPADV